MVLRPEPLLECMESVLGDGFSTLPVLLTSPQGRRHSQAFAERLSGGDRLVIVCGHYEGYDQRILDLLPRAIEVSIGDYVLTGGELAALVLLDSVVRLRPGVLGDAESVQQESFTERRLDHPHYTRPTEYRGLNVPELLRSGDHARIDAWRRTKSLERSRERRPDLFGPSDA